MSLLKPEHLPQDLATTELRREARAVIDLYNRVLASPAFEHNVDIAVLTKFATDEDVPLRERRRAAEVLLRYRVRLLDSLASTLGIREQVLKSLGIDVGARGVSLTQVNTKLEIVRSADWRDSAPEEVPGGRDADAG